MSTYSSSDYEDVQATLIVKGDVYNRGELIMQMLQIAEEFETQNPYIVEELRNSSKMDRIDPSGDGIVEALAMAA